MGGDALGQRSAVRRRRSPAGAGRDCCRSDRSPAAAGPPAGGAAAAAAARLAARAGDLAEQAAPRGTGCPAATAAAGIGVADGGSAWPAAADLRHRRQGRLPRASRRQARPSRKSAQQGLQATSQSSFLTHVRVPPCKVPHRPGRRGTGGVVDHRLAVAGRFGHGHVARNHRLVDDLPEEVADFLVHLVGQFQGVVVHRQHDAAELQAVGLAAASPAR